MSPPISIKNCPKEIQENPLPHDECSEEVKDYKPPQDRFDRFSINLDPNFVLGAPGDGWFRLGGGVIFRPVQWLGIGAQMDWNSYWDNEINAFGRIQGSIPMHQYWMYKLTIAGLAGIKHLYGQEREPENGADPRMVSGTIFCAGAEVAYDIRVARGTWGGLHFSPNLAVLYTPPQKIGLDDDSKQEIKLGHGVDVVLGLRFSWDLLREGE